jgi:hypothetical protein
MTQEAPKDTRCIFVRDWMCPVEADEIPLEVCRICVEARKTHKTVATIHRAAPSGIASDLAKEKPEVPDNLPKDVQKQLSGLDKQFEEGQINFEEYLEKRKNIVESTQNIGT